MKHIIAAIAANYPARVVKGFNKGYRIIAHNYFNRLHDSGFMTKQNAYKMLARKMNKPLCMTHFKSFNIEECVIAIRLLERRYPFLMSGLHKLQYEDHMRIGKQRL